MIRIIPAVPPTPSTTIGSQICLSRSTTFGQFHSGCVAKSGDSRPPMLIPNHSLAAYISSNARRKAGQNSVSQPQWSRRLNAMGRIGIG